MGKCITQRGILLTESKPDEAKEYFEKARQLFLKNNQIAPAAMTYNNIARIEFKKGDTLGAVNMIKKSFYLLLADSMLNYATAIGYNVGLIYAQYGMYDSSMKYLDTTYVMLSRGNFTKLKREILSLKFQLYEELGNSDSLLSIFKEYEDIVDTIISN